MNGDLARQREGCLLWDSEPLIEARDLQIGVLWIILALQSSPIGPGDGVDELLRRGAEHSFDHKAGSCPLQTIFFFCQLFANYSLRRISGWDLGLRSAFFLVMKAICEPR